MTWATQELEPSVNYMAEEAGAALRGTRVGLPSTRPRLLSIDVVCM